MHLDAPGYVLAITPLIYLGIWRLCLSDGEERPHERTLAVVGSLAILWIVISAIGSYA